MNIRICTTGPDRDLSLAFYLSSFLRGGKVFTSKNIHHEEKKKRTVFFFPSPFTLHPSKRFQNLSHMVDVRLKMVHPQAADHAFQGGVFSHRRAFEHRDVRLALKLPRG